MKTTDEVIKKHFGNDYHDLPDVSPNRVAMAMNEFASYMILENENKWQRRMEDLTSKLEDMDSMIMRMEDVLHGEEGMLATKARYLIIEIKNELK